MRAGRLLRNKQMKRLTLLRPWSVTAAVVSMAVCTYNGVWSSFVKEFWMGSGREPHWVVLLFDQSWCIPVGVLLAGTLIAKDLWCPARVATRVNLVVLLAGILTWGIYRYSASQPWTWTLSIHKL